MSTSGADFKTLPCTGRPPGSSSTGEARPSRARTIHERVKARPVRVGRGLLPRRSSPLLARRKPEPAGDKPPPYEGFRE